MTTILATALGLYSFSLDLTGLLSYAEDMFNGLAPAILPVAGIILGVGVLMVVFSLIKSAVKI